jgi:hypothetical protein
VAVGWNGTIVTSPDGLTWTKQKSGTIGYLYSIIYANSQFIVSGDGVFLTSPDAITWTIMNPGTGYGYLYSVTYAGQFVAVGSLGTILKSTDGSNWIIINSGTSWDLRSVTYGNRQFVAVGDSGKILTSFDGMTWTTKSSGTNALLNSVTYANGQSGEQADQFVAVGEGGVILTSNADNIGAIQTNPQKPATRSIKIKITNSFISASLPFAKVFGLWRVELYTISGKRIYSATTKAQNGILKIPSSGFPVGKYSMSITEENNRTSISSFVLTR